jgi:hypothetical protein
MPKIEIDLSDETIEEIRRIWKFNQDKMSEGVLRQLGWTDPATFAGDLLCLGFEVASDDPRRFILHMRERKAPIFREPGQDGPSRTETEDESLKGYA